MTSNFKDILTDSNNSVVSAPPKHSNLSNKVLSLCLPLFDMRIHTSEGMGFRSFSPHLSTETQVGFAQKMGEEILVTPKGTFYMILLPIYCKTTMLQVVKSVLQPDEKQPATVGIYSRFID